MRRSRRRHEAGQAAPSDYFDPRVEEKIDNNLGDNQHEAMFHLPTWHNAQHQRDLSQWNQSETMFPRPGDQTGESWWENNFMPGHPPGSFPSNTSHNPETGRAFVPPQATQHSMTGNYQMQIDAPIHHGYTAPQSPPPVVFRSGPPRIHNSYIEGTHQPDVFHSDRAHGSSSNAFLGHEHLTSIQNITRYQTQAATDLEIAESFESHSTLDPLFSQLTSGNQVMNSRISNASPSTEVNPGNTQEQLFCAPVADTTEDKNEDSATKSPLPQNLRGDPFRSAKVKTELCRHFGKEGGCPFGDKCNYAHGEEELKYKKLMDLEREGQADVEIFRTHACPTWVATGACPFDQRCTGLHDPRIIGSEPSWLPHAETLVNSIGASVNVDKLYHQQLAAVYSCSPIHGYIPTKKWKADEASTMSAWAHFYAFVCDMDPKAVLSSSILSPVPTQRHQLFRDTTSVLSTGKKNNGELGLSELDRILIALKMRQQRLGQCYAYLPSHLFCGELCMVLQTRFFHIQRNDGGVSVIQEVANSRDRSSEDTVTAHEIIFGALSDPSTRQHSIWFNIPKDSLAKCTPQQAKRHKRSRHRLKKNRPEKLKSVTKPIGNSPQKVSDTAEERTIDSLLGSSLNIYQPMDNAAFDLITNIMSHHARVLECLFRNKGSEISHNELHLLKAEQKRLRATFESQRRHWMTWSWPVNLENLEVNDQTDIPPINMAYHFDLDSDDYFQSEHFHGINDRYGPDVVSHNSKLVVGFLWKSFIINMYLLRGQLPPSAAQSVQTSMPSHDIKFYKLRRLPIFRALSLGVGITNLNRQPHTPKGPKTQTHQAIITVSSNESEISTIENLFSSWEVVKAHYKKNQNTTTQESQSEQDNNTTVTSQTNINEQWLEAWLQDKAQMWSRAYLSF